MLTPDYVGPIATTLAFKTFAKTERRTHGTFPDARTSSTGGHPHVPAKKQIDLEDIYDSPHTLNNIYLEPLPMSTAKYYPEIPSIDPDIDWSLVTTKKGFKSYTIEELKAKIYTQHIDLPKKAKTKKDYVDFMLENKKVFK